MGFFSWECAKTRKPILAYMGEDDPYSFASDIVVVFENGDRVSGHYNGYGIINLYNGSKLDLVETTGWRAVIKKYYNNESYSDLLENKPEPRQGYFWDETELFSIFSK